MPVNIYQNGKPTTQHIPAKRQRAKTDTGGGAFKAMLVPNWTGPYQTPDGAFCTADCSPDDRPLSERFR